MLIDQYKAEQGRYQSLTLEALVLIFLLTKMRQSILKIIIKE